jgi:hypothetical protein
MRNLSISSARYRQHPETEMDEPQMVERKHELALQEVERQIQADKKRLKWRTPTYENPNFWQTKFRLFADTENSNMDLVEKMQQPWDFSFAGLKKWFNRRKEARDTLMQSFIPDRHRILGNDLATAHFVVHRGGRVMFQNHDEWMKQDQRGSYKLPSKFVPNMFVEKVDCSNMQIYYEGLQNFEKLRRLTYLSFKNNKLFDDWCLDRISGNEYEALETLDISGTKVTERGLPCLYRILTLKELIIDDFGNDVSWKLTCAMLEEINTKLVITKVPKNVKIES